MATQNTSPNNEIIVSNNSESDSAVSKHKVDEFIVKYQQNYDANSLSQTQQHILGKLQPRTLIQRNQNTSPQTKLSPDVPMYYSPSSQQDQTVLQVPFPPGDCYRHYSVPSEHSMPSVYHHSSPNLPNFEYKNYKHEQQERQQQIAIPTNHLVKTHIPPPLTYTPPGHGYDDLEYQRYLKFRSYEMQEEQQRRIITENGQFATTRQPPRTQEYSNENYGDNSLLAPCTIVHQQTLPYDQPYIRAQEARNTYPVEPVETATLSGEHHSNPSSYQFYKQPHYINFNPNHQQITFPDSTMTPQPTIHQNLELGSPFRQRIYNMPPISPLSRLNLNNSDDNVALTEVPRLKGQLDYHPIYHGFKRKVVPGPMKASKPILSKDPETDDDLLTFEYSNNKAIQEFTIRVPKTFALTSNNKAIIDSTSLNLSDEFKKSNCLYPNAMVPESEYHGKRYKYETDCNEIGWIICWFNEGIRGKKGVLQRAVDSWRNTRADGKLRSRRVRGIIRISQFLGLN